MPIHTFFCIAGLYLYSTHVVFCSLCERVVLKCAAEMIVGNTQLIKKGEERIKE